MRRLQLVEIEDLAWCPRAVRNGATDWLSFMANVSKGVFRDSADDSRGDGRVRTGDVVDLCSGGGGPWLTLERDLAKSRHVNVVLTDRYPNMEALGVFALAAVGDCAHHIHFLASLHPEIATKILA